MVVWVWAFAQMLNRVLDHLSETVRQIFYLPVELTLKSVHWDIFNPLLVVFLFKRLRIGLLYDDLITTEGRELLVGGYTSFQLMGIAIESFGLRVHIGGQHK